MNQVQNSQKYIKRNISNELAINGGQKIRTKTFPAHNTIGKEEEQAVLRVLRSGKLSGFLGSWHKDFYGGPEVQAFEKEWANFFKVKHAIAVNSATSGLYVAVGATGVEPGQEIIVSPYTMSASAIAPLVYNAIPIFADIEEDYFCLDPESVEKNITKNTKAIIVVDLFGQPYDAQKINAIAKKHNLIVIEDCAQAPGAKYKDKFAGTLGDIGVYSLNIHKHITTGEGGVVVTDNDDLAERIRMIRNHAEAVATERRFYTNVNMLGFNFRMTEIEAAIGREQLKKLPTLLKQRINNVSYLENKLSKIPFLQMPKVRDYASHVYYMHAIKFDQKIADIDRDCFINLVKAELAPTEGRELDGVNIRCGYLKPLYLQSLYQEKWVYGKQCFPWNLNKSNREIDYKKGLCPVSEKMYEEKVLVHDFMHPNLRQQDLDDVILAFKKVFKK